MSHQGALLREIAYALRLYGKTLFAGIFMSKINKIHITGASGSGTTSIAARLATITGFTHLDTDDFYWHATKPPFTAVRECRERQQLLLAALTANTQWILSGSLCGWGDKFIPLFDLVVYVYVQNNTRIERIRKRELARYGESILPGGVEYERNRQFIAWASAYDTSTEVSRNAFKHKQWLEKIACPVIEINNHAECDEAVNVIVANISLP
ncbi:Uncharacterised protein [Serratia fonticola]|nr:Uncharacterised protein [Serratia fonticola]